jgi:hypothetical protein
MHGADVDYQGWSERAPLHLVSIDENVDVMQWLLKWGHYKSNQIAKSLKIIVDINNLKN